MKFDCIVGNPPYGGNLHLKVINTIIKHLTPKGYCCFIHPSRWLQDPLWKWKKSCDMVRFKNIFERIYDVYFIDNKTTNKLFGISFSGELMLSKINNVPTDNDIKIFNDIATEAINIILSYSLKNNIGEVFDYNKRDGWRCQINGNIPASNGGDGLTRRKGFCNIFELKENNVFFDGKTKDGLEWFEIRGKNQYDRKDGTPLPYSIKFNTENEALNFEKSCNCNFYNNILYLLKTGTQTPLNFLPYMHDYTHPWTDEDYCRFFEKYGMSKECQEWMCREVYDYRVKDFVEYAKIDK